MKLNITRFTKAVLDIMFVLGILITATLPFLLKTYGKYVEPGIRKVHMAKQCGIGALWNIFPYDCMGVKKNV